MFEDHLYWLDQIHASHRLSVGDKAFYLSLLAQRGEPVIPGFVISASLFRLFLEQIEWAEPMFADLPYSSLHVDVDNPRQLQAVSQQIRQTLAAAPMPEAWLNQLEDAVGHAVSQWSGSAVILRPSIALPSGFDPTVSLKATGLLEARICNAEPPALVQSLKQVWAELFRAKSLLYWQRLRIQPQQINLGVLVQPIANAIASGEVQIHQTHLEIRAIWGLGRALTSGDVAPDQYHIDLQTGLHTYRTIPKLYAYQLAAPAERPSDLVQLFNPYELVLVAAMQQTQPVLTKAQLQQLIQLCQKAAADLGSHLGLEWTLMPCEDASSCFYLTQVTPQLKMGRWEGESRKSSQRDSHSLEVTQMPDAAHILDATALDATALDATESSPLIAGLAAAPGTVIATAWVSHQTLPSLLDMPMGMILVAPHITPDWLPWMKQAAGIITEQGGMTSHGAVLAREIGIPAITGAIKATQIIKTGDHLLIDGDRGEVHRMVEDAEPKQAGNRTFAQPSEGRDELLSSSPLLESILQPEESSTALPIATQLWVTLSQPSALARVTDLPIDGLGLLRSELMMLEILEQRHPDAWIQEGQQTELSDRIARQLQLFAQAFAPRPVFYRSADLRSHEFAHLQGAHSGTELNPVLGLRGTLRYQVEPALFDVELAALQQVQQQGYTNVRLMLPFVRTVEEFSFCRQRIEQSGLAQHPLFQLWIMAEVPSVLLLLSDYIQAGVQGIAIGSSDLTQLLLGVDRDQPQMATAFNPLHPAVLRAIQQLIQMARQAQIPCSICGQAAGQYPDLIDALVRWGITAISVNPDEVIAVRETIARAEKRLLLDAARQRLKQ